MNKLEQAARQALEALEKYADWRCTPKTEQTITALREALAEQAEQEPVAERKAQVNELIKESARLIASISDEGDRYLTAIDMLRNAYRLGLKDAAPVQQAKTTSGINSLERQEFLYRQSQDFKKSQGGNGW